MTVQQMREELKKAIRTDSWRDKVNAMADNQVIAVYYRFKNTGKV